MAEYMTREQAIEILNRDDSEMRKGYFCINDFNAIEVLKTADVVERSKIDKAIEEINDMPTIGYYEEPLGSRPMVFKDDILTILKRNIGE